MERDMVKAKLREMSRDLFRLTDRVIAEDGPAKVRYVVSHGTGLYCRVYVAEDGQDLTADGNVYSLYESPEKWEQTQGNYQRCKARLVGILTKKKS